MTVLYSVNFVFVCPNCHREQLQTVGRTETVYVCRWCDKRYTIQLSIQATDADGKVFTD